MVQPRGPQTRTVRVENLEAIQSRLDIDVLAQSEFDAALETFRKRFERQGKGLGAKRNTLMSDVAPLSVRVESTRNWPRTKGTAWGRKNERIAKGMASRVVKSAIRKIGERWATEASG